MSDPLYQRTDISVIKFRKGRHRVSEVMKEMLEQGALVTVECMELTLESTEDIRLQAIATAYRAHRAAMGEGQFRDTENHLFNLLDALTKENTDD